MVAIREQIANGRYAEAERAAERLLLDLETPNDGPRQLAASDLVIEAAILNGHGHEPHVRQLAESVVERRRASGAAGTAGELSGSLRNLGDVLFQAARYNDAIVQFREALRRAEEAGDEKTAGTAALLAHLSQALSQVGRQAEALPLAEQALAIAETVSPSRVLTLAEVLGVRAQVYQRLADYPKAHVDLQRAVDLLEQNDSGHPRTASTMAQLGYQLVLEGEAIKARDVLTRAVATAETAYRPDHPEIAVCWWSLASDLVELGDLTTARQLSQRALDIAQRVFGLDHPQVAVQMNDLANTLLRQGDYLAARRLYEQALGIYERFSGSESLGAAATVYNLALLSDRLGDFREARRQFLRVIALWGRIKGPAHPDVARALSALAETLAVQGLDGQARTFYERALTIRERTLGSHHPLVAVTLSSLASTLARQHQIRRASSLSTRALTIWEQSGGQEGFAASLMLHGELISRAGDFPGARRSFARALEIRVPRLGPAHPDVAATEIALAVSEAQTGDRATALARALRGERAGREHLRLMLAALPEREALDYAAARPKGLDLAISLTSQPLSSRPLLDAIIARALSRPGRNDQETAGRHTVCRSSNGSAVEHSGGCAPAAREPRDQGAE